MKTSRKDNLNIAQGPSHLYYRGLRPPISANSGNQPVTTHLTTMGWKPQTIVVSLASRMLVVYTAKTICLNFPTGTSTSWRWRVVITTPCQHMVPFHQVQCALRLLKVYLRWMPPTLLWSWPPDPHRIRKQRIDPKSPSRRLVHSSRQEA